MTVSGRRNKVPILGAALLCAAASSYCFALRAENCAKDKCFYSSCIRTGTTGVQWKYFDQCTVDGKAQDQGHTGKSNQSYGDAEGVNPPVNVKWWDAGSGTADCTATTYPHDASCTKPDRDSNNTVTCSKCKSLS